MIFGNINNLKKIDIYPKAIQKAINYLKETDLKSKEPGVYEIEGKDIFIQVIDIETDFRENKKPEVHRKYIDVQSLISGEEQIGFSTDLGNNKILKEYDKDNDILFYENCEDESTLEMVPGSFAVFFPNDIHIPACAKTAKTKVRKVIIKIDIEIL